MYINWGPIKTINDDRTEPGFETMWHEHKNLDILSYVVRVGGAVFTVGTCGLIVSPVQHRGDQAPVAVDIRPGLFQVVGHPGLVDLQ